jgi:hypothetical protein
MLGIILSVVFSSFFEHAVDASGFQCFLFSLAKETWLLYYGRNVHQDIAHTA